MQLDIGMVFSSLIGLFLLMGVGWVSVKAKIVPPSASAPMSSLLLKVTLPCTIFSSLATREFDSDRKSTRQNSSHIRRSRMPSSA